MAPVETHDGKQIAYSTSEPNDFGAIFERHFDAIHRFVARRLGASLADEIAASVFTEAFAGRARFLADRADARPWLYGITTNLIRRHRRRERAAWSAYAKHGVDPIGIDMHPRLDEVAIARALSKLPSADRDALLLFAWADLTYDEIAIALDLPVGTVRSRLSRARARLRADLEDLR